MHAYHNLAADKTVGDKADLPVASVLEPVAVLAAHPTTRAKLVSGTLVRMAF